MAEVGPSEFLVFKSCRDALKQRLTKPLLKLFAQATGLRLHVFWHHPFDFHRPDRVPVVCPSTPRKGGPHSPFGPSCEACLRQWWDLATAPDGRVRQFRGQCGATNFCVSLRIGAVRPVTLVLQSQGRGTHIRSASSAAGSASAGGRTDFSAAQGRSAVNLPRAAAMLRLVLHDLEATAQARLAQQELEAVRRRLRSQETEDARLRRELHQRLPDLPEAPSRPRPGGRSQSIVQVMLDYLHQNYHRPVQLGEAASLLKMNAAYLSTVFSRSLGVTFHHYLEELRFSQAKELLRDPRNRIGEVACAVGYTSLDSFRHAFKTHAGVPPSEWRERQ